MTRTVRAIHVASGSGAPVEARDRVRAVARQGLEGDRYFDADGTFDDRDGASSRSSGARRSRTCNATT